MFVRSILIMCSFTILCAGIYFGAIKAVTSPPQPLPSEAERQLLTLHDGPYAWFLPQQQLLVNWVCHGQVQQLLLNLQQQHVIPARCQQAQDIPLASHPIAAAPELDFSASKVAIISDLHGQYALTIQLLQAQGIIDRDLNWQFGSGHLVLAGDLMDRGEQVTELLWLFYRLDQQAQAAGGRFHMLLGNHETMVLYNDLRYIHTKYRQVETVLGKNYSELYAADTVLGQWLRSKPVLLKLNDMLIMHAGVHPDYLALGLSMAEVNELYRQSLGIARAELMEQPVLAFLYGRLGPIWYRGYFREENAITLAQLDDLLQRFAVRHIVVGHTSMDSVYQHYQGRVYSVDSDIKKGKSGSLLLWLDGQFYRGSLDGRRDTVPVYTPAHLSAQGSE
ncbi:MAG: metallophosphoesterase [Alishewanella aestuarii]